MYADDTVIFSDTISGLQKELDYLANYCDLWSLTVNTSKTKIMVFRNRGGLKACEKWHFEKQEIEIVDRFNYLGLLFTIMASAVLL